MDSHKECKDSRSNGIWEDETEWWERDWEMKSDPPYKHP